jgi:hypothetical protein
MFAVITVLLCLAVPCLAQTFTLDPTNNCPEFTEGYSVQLAHGTYNIEYVSGAWSPIPRDEIFGGYAWEGRVNVYVYANGLSGVFGPATNYLSPELAEAASKGIYTLIIPTNTVVSFWLAELVNPFNDCSDNRGSVTLRFVSPLATAPTTWGAVKALYR